MISLIIPVTSKNREYTEHISKHIDELYPDRTKVEVIVRSDDKSTLGQNYNAAVEHASGEKIILLHNDMVLSRGFIERMDRDIKPGRITTYTRVEPPIFKDHKVVGKIIHDCGSDLETFDKELWDRIEVADQLLDGGSQLFFGCMKKDYIGIDGDTFKMFCEDDDLHLRYSILGFEKKVSSAAVYHFGSKTSRVDETYRAIEKQSQEAFRKKWDNILFIK